MGAGGLSNALPELVKDGGTGGHFELRVPNAETGMSPVETGVMKLKSAMFWLKSE